MPKAQACFVPPMTLMQSTRELIERTESIVLAKVTEHKKGDFFDTFTFESVEHIKGKAPALFNLKGFDVNDNDYRPEFDDFDSHSSREWQLGDTNSTMPGDCEAYGFFQKGMIYLIFYAKPSHIKAYEQIQSSNDLWLTEVKSLLRNHSKATQ